MHGVYHKPYTGHEDVAEGALVREDQNVTFCSTNNTLNVV